VVAKPAISWYGDIALAPDGEGGVVFFWSQERERFGLFARRFLPAGGVGVEESPALRAALTGLRFTPGVGVRAYVAVPQGRLDLFDPAGRRTASRGVDGTGASLELTLPGTAELNSGIYFARLVAGPEVVAGRVAVLR
jgi:hypothetical protein